MRPQSLYLNIKIRVPDPEKRLKKRFTGYSKIVQSTEKWKQYSTWEMFRKAELEAHTLFTDTTYIICSKTPQPKFPYLCSLHLIWLCVRNKESPVQPIQNSSTTSPRIRTLSWVPRKDEPGESA